MLILELGIDEFILLYTTDGIIRVGRVGVPGNKVRLGFEAPRKIKILREHLTTNNAERRDEKA